jgi:hypothetical protein
MAGSMILITTQQSASQPIESIGCPTINAFWLKGASIAASQL